MAHLRRGSRRRCPPGLAKIGCLKKQRSNLQTNIAIPLPCLALTRGRRGLQTHRAQKTKDHPSKEDHEAHTDHVLDCQAFPQAQPLPRGARPSPPRAQRSSFRRTRPSRRRPLATGALGRARCAPRPTPLHLRGKASSTRGHPASTRCQARALPTWLRVGGPTH